MTFTIKNINKINGSAGEKQEVGSVMSCLSALMRRGVTIGKQYIWSMYYPAAISTLNFQEPVMTTGDLGSSLAFALGC